MNTEVAYKSQKSLLVKHFSILPGLTPIPLQPLSASTATAYRRLALPSGAFAMLAADQRESLRAMFKARTGDGHVPDSLLEEFKVALARELGPYVSAVLLDRLQGEPAMRALRTDVPACGVILAADKLIQPEGGPVTSTEIDSEIDPVAAVQSGISALKLLVIWDDDSAGKQRCISTTESFLASCRAAGLPGIVEAIVKAPPAGGSWDREQAIVEAASELGACGPDIYKAEVPFHGKAGARDIAAVADRISAVLSCPWVVLSSGVAADDFPDAVAAACAGGASGFLAGRAIWRDAVHSTDFVGRLREISVPRARRLVEIVDTAGRPWHEVSPQQ